MLLPPYFSDKKAEAQERSKLNLELSPRSVVGVLNINASQVNFEWSVNPLGRRKIHVFQF